MSWHSIRGHDRVVAELRRSLEHGRFPHALLFVGPEGVGKRTFARKLAQALLTAAGGDERRLRRDLDLVALATVADVVPLLGENRALLRRGLRALAGTSKPGLRALMVLPGR